MVLLINESVYTRQCTLENLAQHADLIHTTSQLASTDEIKQPTDEISRTIYVHQREFAVLNKTDPHGFHLLGSDDATTCHIFILDCPYASALAHLDGHETRNSIERMLQELKQYAPENQQYDVYVMGGFIDGSSREYSRNLSNEILGVLSANVNVKFRLKLAAVTNYNDHVINHLHYPMIYGICFDIHTKTLRKMNFIDFGPAFRLRSVYLSVNSDSAWCIYTSSKGSIAIEQFPIDRNIVERYFKRLYKYYFHNDELLLKNTSTSPAQERPSYLPQMKKTILYILKYAEQIPQWFDPQTHSIVYYRSNNQWITDNRKMIEDIELE